MLPNIIMAEVHNVYRALEEVYWDGRKKNEPLTDKQSVIKTNLISSLGIKDIEHAKKLDEAVVRAQRIINEPSISKLYNELSFSEKKDLFESLAVHWYDVGYSKTRKIKIELNIKKALMDEIPVQKFGALSGGIWGFTASDKNNPG